jgi:hypothetical protein
MKNATRHGSVTDGTDYPPILVEAGREAGSVPSGFRLVVAEATMLVLPVPVPPASSGQAARSPEG